MRGRLISSLLLATLFCPAYSYLRLSSIFSDNMVLQSGEATPIYGFAAPGEKVRVSVAGERATCVAGGDGKWRATIRVLANTIPTAVDVATTTDHVTLKNVLRGEVWICSGQSNMEWSFHDAKVAGQRTSLGNPRRPTLRLFQVRHAVATAPREEVQGRWVESTPDSVNAFSMLGYLFGSNLQDRLGGAVGIIESDWGGTPAQAWAPEQTLADGFASQAAATTQGTAPVAGNTKVEQSPGVLFNGMIHPLLQFGFKGITWYQGEANVGHALQYRTLFPALIRAWRQDAGRDFPFLFVQLANFARSPSEDDGKWARLRQAQASALALPNTGMATAADLSADGTVHNIQRHELAKRLAWLALYKAYDRKSAYTAPMVSGIRFSGSEAYVDFDGKLNGLLSHHPEGIAGFEVAGDDKVWRKAFARIDRGIVVVYSPKVARPVAVRYGWGDDPELSLYNSAGLPALPFRTDDWGN